MHYYTFSSFAYSLVVFILISIPFTNSRFNNTTVVQLETLTTYPFPTVISDAIWHSKDSLLLTFTTPAELQSITPNAIADPKNPDNKAAYQILHSFDEQACGGIAYLGNDKYLLVTSNLQVFPKTNPAPGTHSLYIINLEAWTEGTKGVVVNKLVGLPEAKWLISIVPLPKSKNSTRKFPLVLISDAMAGSILQFDPDTKQSATWFTHPSMQPSPKADVPVGINGLRYFNGYVYYTNTFAHSLYRLAVCDDSWTPNGKPELMIQDPEFPHGANFEIQKAPGVPQLYVTGSNRVVKVAMVDGGRWTWTDIAGGANDTIVAGATSAVKGRVGLKEKMWVVTGGSLLSPWIKGFREGGKVVRMDI
ncbi:uncharacterized protein BDR25DRAFT_367116 [Lindgomyces ingoldianus]|uniref:Uncharacterized protein n=1 Tax=Lindgomyces ingoldianus TaxID=673940 RepID=A0ACB6QZ21_9PLEO|nr:uncharacterized protein BDR25DRAFT_367116 [Lindgomyces ingoldianus]KAF2472299.1 hypothetical protein BDR25DRAFT_367116 [Lindgomyces ingoldianus]